MQLNVSGKTEANDQLVFLRHKVPMTYIIEGEGALVNEAGEETPLKAGDFALVNPEGLTQVIPVKNTNTEIKAINPLR